MGGDIDSEVPASVEPSDDELETSPLEAESPLETEAEPVEEDWSWMEPLKAHRQLHGLELSDIVTALASGSLPDPLLKILKVKLKDGDNEWEDTIDGARRGAMMRRDYSRKTQQLAEERDSFTADRDEFVSMLHGWKSDPKRLKAGLQHMGFPFLEAAKLLAEEHRQLAALPPEARALYEEKTKAEAELQKLKYEQERASKLQARESEKAQTQKRVDFVTQSAQPIFQASGVPLNKGTWGVFLRHFDAISRANPGTEWNEHMVRFAVEATAEEYNELKSQMNPAPAAAPAATAAVKVPANGSPARAQIQKAGLAGGQTYDSATAPKPRPKGGRITIADFRKKIGM